MRKRKIARGNSCVLQLSCTIVKHIIVKLSSITTTLKHYFYRTVKIMQHVYCLDNDDNFFLGSIFWLQYIKDSGTDTYFLVFGVYLWYK